MAGEVGECCNEIKKLRRIAATPEDAATPKDNKGYRDQLSYSEHVENVGKELADIIIYADLLAARLGISLEAVIVQKFNEVSARVNSNIRL